MVFFKALQTPLFLPLPCPFPAPLFARRNEPGSNLLKPDSTEYATIIRNLTLLTTTSIFLQKNAAWTTTTTTTIRTGALCLFLLCFCSTHFQQLMAKRRESGLRRGAVGYTQTYLIWKSATSARRWTTKGAAARRRTSRWSTRCCSGAGTGAHGHVEAAQRDRARGHAGGDSLLQRQQSRLHYYCNAESIPPQSNFFQPMQFVRRGGLRRALPGGGPRDGRARAAWTSTSGWRPTRATLFSR